MFLELVSLTFFPPVMAELLVYIGEVASVDDIHVVASVDDIG